MNFGKLSMETVLDAFDERWYLETYPDVATAVQEGLIESGRRHFERNGREEGRAAFEFHAEWYATSYPLAVEEVDSGRVSSLLEHYLVLGRPRGYLSNLRAPRPRGASLATGAFGGLWIDAPNASDLVRGRLETGAITATEAERLSFFIEHGYVVLPRAIPAAVLHAAKSAIEEAYSGKFPGLKFECHSISKEERPWCAEMNELPAKAIDPHMFSRALRDAMFGPEIVRFLALLFETVPLASQTLGFLRGSAQEPHQDSAYVAYSVARNFAATWIALEDATAGAGELLYYPSSHRFPDYLYGGKYKSVSEARRMGVDSENVARDVRAHVKTLPTRAEEMGLERERFLPRAGDVLVWHPELAHGGSPVSQAATRKSLVTHYCPKYLVPLFMERSTCRIYQHSSGGRFVSGAYPWRAPMD
jgi:ectoine hydroxylase-related dioxygenase (phytanoyl-CoA dioxygenase family)